MPAVWLAVAAFRVVAADNVDYRPAVAACMVEEPDASRNGFGGSGNAQRTSRLHEVALHVDYYHCFHAPKLQFFPLIRKFPIFFEDLIFILRFFRLILQHVRGVCPFRLPGRRFASCVAGTEYFPFSSKYSEL